MQKERKKLVRNERMMSKFERANNCVCVCVRAATINRLFSNRSRKMRRAAIRMRESNPDSHLQRRIDILVCVRARCHGKWRKFVNMDLGDRMKYINTNIDTTQTENMFTKHVEDIIAAVCSKRVYFAFESNPSTAPFLCMCAFWLRWNLFVTA